MRRSGAIVRLPLARTNRRTLYRHAKKTLHRALGGQWTDSRANLDRRIRGFLRGKNYAFLLRLARQHVFALAVATALLTGSAAHASPPIELSDISMNANSGGFIINGADVGDVSGISVSGAGDVNGDGFADLIIGAAGGDPAGESYVVFSPIPGLVQWVDFAFTGTPDGTQTSPFQQFAQALNAVTDGGTINIKGDTAVSSTSGSFTLDKPVTIQAVNGTVTLGVP